MPAVLRDEIRELRARFWSDRDPKGRAFAPLADAYRRAGDLDEAADLVEEGTDRLPDFVAGHLVAARVYRDRGEGDGAHRAFRRVLELDPENLEALRGAAVLAEESGRTGEALELWQRLARLDPGEEAAAVHIRELKLRHFRVAEGAESDAASGEAEAAPATGEESEDHDGGEGEETEVYTRTMAELYVRQGLEERAVEVYRRLAEQRPDDEELRSRLEELESRRGGGAGGSEEARPSAPPPAPPRPETDGLDADDEVEALAREWASGPEVTGELSTPFAWGEEGTAERPSADGLSIASYFERILAWEPEASGETPSEEAVVPVESLAPDPEPPEESRP